VSSHHPRAGADDGPADPVIDQEKLETSFEGSTIRTRLTPQGVPFRLMIEPIPRSPRILQIAWGEMVVAGLPAGKDFKLYPGGGRAWDWSENGTQHEPGILPADVGELLDHGADVIVLSRGMHLRLQTAPATLRLLEERSITVHQAETTQAVALYNELTATRAVAGLFHSTC
jgi:hypothetical protein